MRKVDLRRAVVLAVGVLSLAAPASAGAFEACPSQPLAQAFLPWGDAGWYGQVPDGGMESREGAWRLGGPAQFASPNEPFFVRSRGDLWSLSLAAGASGASAPTCIELGHPTLRFFVRNTGAVTAGLQVSVEYVDLAGIPRSQRIAVLTGSSAWAPTPILPMLVNLTSPLTAQEVAVRFTASGGSWQIDDVFVDPYGKG
jgi:hypothetical protein